MATASPSAPQSKLRSRRWFRLLLLLTAVPYFGLVILLTLFQRSLIYVPRRVPHIPISTAALPHASVEAIRVPTEDGLELHGWWFRSHDSDSSIRDERRREWARGKPLILYFCGNAGHRGYRLAEFDLLTAWGADVLCCDYRGYGDNAGRPSEEGLAADARAAWNFATQNRAIRPEQIVLFGESLGGAIAIRLAAEMSSAGIPPAGLVTRSTFSSLSDVAAPVFPCLPVRWMLWDRYPSDLRIGNVSCPIALIHGQHDTIVPHELGVKLFVAAPPRSSDGTPKRMIDLPSADHNDVLETEGRAFGAAIGEFLNEVCPRRVVDVPTGSMLGPIERSLIYHPAREETLAPIDLGLPADRFQPISIATDDSLNLHGWHVLADGHTAGNRQDCDGELALGRPLTLFFCGNGGNRSWRISEFDVLTAAGSDVFVVDYRGYGENPGTPSEEKIAADAQSLWRYTTGERQVAPRRIVLYGESLGGAVAARLASERCVAGTPPAGLVLRSTFTSLPDVARELYPWLPVRLIMSERYPSLERIAQVNCPLLVLHGRRDSIVPFEHGAKLFETAPQRSADGTPKQFVALPNSDHNDVLEADGLQFRQAIGRFMARVSR